MMSSDTKDKVEARLRRISGQVEGIRRMVEDDRYCVDTLLQVAAVQSALAKVGQMILDSHVRTCVSAAMTSGSDKERKKKIDELMDVVGRYTHLRPR